MALKRIDIVSWLKDWFYTETEVDNLLSGKAGSSHTHGNVSNDGKVGTASGKIITTGTGGAIQASDSITKSQISDFPSTMTPSSHTHGSVTNDGKIGSDSGKIITTGTGGVLQASNSITKSQISDFPSTMTPASHTHGNVSNDGKIGSTSGLPIITGSGGILQAGSFGSTSGTFVEGDDSRLSDARTPTAHTQASSTITDNNTYTHINNSSGTQESINAAIDNKLGALAGVETYEITTADANGKPNLTASADTMNKLFLIKAANDKEDNYDIFITIRSGTLGSYTYAWEKIDSTTIDLSGYAQTSSLATVATSGSYADLTNKPTYTATVTSSTTGAYKIGSLNISGASVDIYGKDTDTHQALTSYSQKTETIDIDNIQLIAKGETNEGCIVFNTIS